MTQDSNHNARPEGLDPHRFYGRRKGPSLSQHQDQLMTDLLPKLLIDQNDAQELDPTSLFDQPVEKVWFEVGFGKGEHLAWQAANNPHIGFIGCEPYLNGVAALVNQIDSLGLKNVRLYTDDARRIMRTLKPASVDRLFLLHPDPWPKFRHAKRRFVGPKNLDLISRVLRDGGEFRVGTDHPIYREWTVLQLSNRHDFEWMAKNPSDWLTKPDDWPDTRYETKALEGRPVYLRYRKTA